MVTLRLFVPDGDATYTVIFVDLFHTLASVVLVGLPEHGGHLKKKGSETRRAHQMNNETSNLQQTAQT